MIREPGDLPDGHARATFEGKGERQLGSWTPAREGPGFVRSSRGTAREGAAGAVRKGRSGMSRGGGMAETDGTRMEASR